MKRLCLAACLCLFAVPVLAQTATPSSKVGFDQAGPDLATVQAYTYKYYADGATTGAALPAATCTGTASPFACTVPFPAFTPGNHTLTLTASNAAGESAQSTPPLAFTMVVTPTAPTNVTIK